MEILLRRFNSKDLDDLHEYAKVKGVGEMAGWTHHKSIKETKEILDTFVKDRRVFAITVDGKVIGSVSLRRTTKQELFPDLKFEELGYVISKEYWGKNIAVVATSLILGFAFDNLKLDAVIATHFVDNKQSQRVLEKCKFTYIKNINYNNKEYKLHIIKKEEILKN